MAANLVKAGHRVIGVDPSPQAAAEAEGAGVTIAAGVAEAVADADVVIMMLPNGGVVEKVLTGDDGVFAHLPAGALVADCSTIDVPTAQRMHEAAAQSGHRYVDAPVSGGVTGAEQATLTFMVGGRGTGRGSGPPDARGDGQAGRPRRGSRHGRRGEDRQQHAPGHLLGRGVRGLRPGRTPRARPQDLLRHREHVLGQLLGAAHLDAGAGDRGGHAVSNDWKPGFATTLMIKDMRLATGAGRDTSTQFDMASTAAGIFERFAGEGNGELDCTGIIELIRGKV